MNKIALSTEKLQKEVYNKSTEDYNSLQNRKFQRTLKDHKEEMKR